MEYSGKVFIGKPWEGLLQNIRPCRGLLQNRRIWRYFLQNKTLSWNIWERSSAEWRYPLQNIKFWSELLYTGRPEVAFYRLEKPVKVIYRLENLERSQKIWRYILHDTGHWRCLSQTRRPGEVFYRTTDAGDVFYRIGGPKIGFFQNGRPWEGYKTLKMTCIYWKTWRGSPQ